MKQVSFCSKESYVEALTELCSPLSAYYSDANAYVNIGHTGAHYGDKIIGLEGFSRILWGVVPLWKGGGESGLEERILDGLRNGSNPEHEEYWGEFYDVSQAFVEMAVFGLALLLTPERIWNPLGKKERENLEQWLLQINTYRVSDNNWLFFRVLVNCGLKQVGATYSEEKLEEALNRIDDFYLGDGWYSDGDSMQRDYYVPFAMHFYSLIYAVTMGEEDPARSKKYKERAAKFAQDYIYWFGKSGEALPFGRSLTYRFAQAGFWCALAFADVEALPFGVMKGIVNRHFRYWFQNPILDCEDKLTIGYAYPNLNMAEGYNSPSSPYWALKSFLVLALDQGHPFWQAEEEALPSLPEIKQLIHPCMLIRQTKQGHVLALTAGQVCAWEPAHWAEKYEKFAYSSYFGFQVPKSYSNLCQAAPDHMLSFWKDGYCHIRRRCQEVTIEKDRIISVWSPFEGVSVVTESEFEGSGYLCRHKITSDGAYLAAQGGFALPIDETEELIIQTKEKKSYVGGKRGSSTVCLRKGEGTPKQVQCEANTNLLYPRTVLPYIEFFIREGEQVVEVYVEGEER